MLNPSGFKISETLFKSTQTQVFRAISDNDHQSYILRTCGSSSSLADRSRLPFIADILNRFKHENIVKVVGFIDHPNQPWLVMEDVQAIDLKSYLGKFEDRQLPISDFLDLVIQLVDALSVVHHAQVIHKDLHPGNIVVNPETKRLQIIDFGLASLLTREQPVLASPENLEGILAYLSPEQTGRMNRALDYRTDFYTLGVVFYELLTGCLPFEADDALGMVYAHMAVKQQPAKDVRQDIAPALSNIIEKLLSKNAEDRYQSALGLKHDLCVCRESLSSGGIIKYFALCQYDVSDHFHIPQVLYGRENEVETLMMQFYRASAGQSQLMSVSGYSGIGKSALVHEVHKPIAAHNGLFISGKFVQLQQNIPYSALKVALRVWINQCLGLPDSELTTLRLSLLDALGDNAGVLIDFMDEFEGVLGALSPVKPLAAQESQARFYLVLRRFVSTVTKAQPWILFIDDVQWADRGTLNLLPELLNEELCRLYIIVAYRDNEVSENHPAIQMIEQASHQSKEGRSVVSQVSLKNLPKQQLTHLLMDTLHRSVEDIEPLAKLIQEKTKGNPFFTIEFLKTLYSQNLLNFDLKAGYWTWCFDEISAQSITDNVVELMLGKMETLPDYTQKILQVAACIGTQFDLETLAYVTNQDISDASYCLWPAIKEGLLIQEGGDWFLGVMGGHEEPIEGQQLVTEGLHFSPEHSCPSVLRVPHCKFLHDRMLQAAYESIDELDRQEMHLNIGRLLYQFEQSKPRHKQDFEIVEQLNHGIKLIAEPDEKLRLAELNLSAAGNALSASVWSASLQYSGYGLSLLSSDSWSNHFDLTLALKMLSAECHYLLGDLDASESIYDEVLLYVTEPLARAEIYATRLIQGIGAGNWRHGLAFGKMALECVGVKVPSEGDDLRVVLEQQQAELAVIDWTSRDLSPEKLGSITGEARLIASRLLPNLGQVCFILGETDLHTFFFQRAMQLICKEGQSEFTPLILSCYGSLLALNESYQQAKEMSALAHAYIEQYPKARELSNAYNMLAGLVDCLFMPYQECIQSHQKGYEYGMDHGELARAAICKSNILFFKISLGEPLISIIDEATETAQIVERGAIFAPATFAALRVANALRYEEGVHVFDDDKLSEAFLAKAKLGFHYSYLCNYRAQLAFWYGDYDIAIKHAEQAQDLLQDAPKFSFINDQFFQYALMLLVSQSKGDLSAKLQGDLSLCTQKLKTLAAFYPPNFAHKYILLRAEKARLHDGGLDVCMPLYEQAIAAAAEGGFRSYQALAHELYGYYLAGQGLERFSIIHIEDAFRLYQVWGCVPKLRALSERYSFLQFDVQYQDSVSKSHGVGIDRVDTSQSQVTSLTTSNSITKVRNAELDLDSIIKSTQAISGELAYEKLTEQVMKVIMENAGAQYGALLVGNEKGATIVALVDEQNIHAEGFEHCPLHRSELVPQAIIGLTLRNQTLIKLNDAVHEGEYTADPYVRRKRPRSVLSIPVLYRDEMIGALYLENNLSVAAFTDSGLDTLRLLLSQAAISFENAKLFTEVNELNAGLEVKVKNRTEELNQAVQELELANKELETFSYSVSHDLRSPLRTMKGYSEILLEDHGGSLDPEAKFLLKKIAQGGEKMAELINGLLDLSRVQRQDVNRQQVSLSDMAEGIVCDLRERYPERNVTLELAQGLEVSGDKRMLFSLMENLLNNAWKYSGKKAQAKISFGSQVQDDKTVYFIKDNGAGFNMDYYNKLFVTFQRLHKGHDFEGTGVGLGTVKRIAEKHGGQIWAEAEVGKGATFYFTLE